MKFHLDTVEVYIPDGFEPAIQEKLHGGRHPILVISWQVEL